METLQLTEHQQRQLIKENYELHDEIDKLNNYIKQLQSQLEYSNKLISTQTNYQSRKDAFDIVAAYDMWKNGASPKSIAIAFGYSPNSKSMILQKLQDYERTLQ